MSEMKSILLVFAAGTVLGIALILGLAAVGVTGPGLGLGAIVPLALGSFAISAIVGRDSEGSKPDR